MGKDLSVNENNIAAFVLGVIIGGLWAFVLARTFTKKDQTRESSAQPQSAATSFKAAHRFSQLD